MSSERLAIQRLADIFIVDFMEKRIVDQLAIAQINESLKEVVEKAGCPKIVLNFANVSHISSAMIGVVMTIHKVSKKAGGEVRLAAINDSIMTVFKLCKIDKMMKIFPDVDKATVKF